MQSSNSSSPAHHTESCEEHACSTLKSRNAVLNRGSALNEQSLGLDKPVVSIKGLSSSAKANDFCEDKLLPGDIVEQVSVGGITLDAPFSGRKAGLQRELRRFFNIGETLVEVCVRRIRKKSIIKLQASIVPDDSMMLKKQYALRAIHDASHVVAFMDSTEEACIAVQEMKCARVVSQLTNTSLKDAYVPYPWECKMQQCLPLQGTNVVFSILFVPYAARDPASPSYNSVEDTVARAMTWLVAAQCSGIPINFLNIQTEPLLTKVSGQQASKCTVSASSCENLSSVVNTGIYGFEDYHGIDIGVMRAVRLWYVPIVPEVAIVLKPGEEESRLGVGICRTDEGFCCVSSVEAGSVADRAGLKKMHRAARKAGKQLVISRVEEEKITPTMVSSTGCVRCYDTVSISEKLAMHRRTGQPLRINVMPWGGTRRNKEKVREEVCHGPNGDVVPQYCRSKFDDVSQLTLEDGSDDMFPAINRNCKYGEKCTQGRSGHGTSSGDEENGQKCRPSTSDSKQELDRVGSFSFRIISNLHITH